MKKYAISYCHSLGEVEFVLNKYQPTDYKIFMNGDIFLRLYGIFGLTNDKAT